MRVPAPFPAKALQQQLHQNHHQNDQMAREQRLAELEKERRLFAASLTASSMANPAFHATPKHQHNHNQNHSQKSNSHSPSSARDQPNPDCFAAEMAGLRAKIKTDKDGRQSFIQDNPVENVTPFPENNNKSRLARHVPLPEYQYTENSSNNINNTVNSSSSPTAIIDKPANIDELDYLDILSNVSYSPSLLNLPPSNLTPQSYIDQSTHPAAYSNSSREQERDLERARDREKDRDNERIREREHEIEREIELARLRERAAIAESSIMNTRRSSVNSRENQKRDSVSSTGTARGRSLKEKEKSSTATSSAAAAKKKRSTSADAWKQLLQKDAKTRNKFYQTDKTLLAIIEDERSKYIHLEAEYHKLLGEVQALHTSHRQELLLADRKTSTETRSLQQSLVIKSEELSLLQKDLARLQSRYAKESTGWISANERLQSQLDKLVAVLGDTETRVIKQDAHINDLKASRSSLMEKLSQRDKELKAASELVREKEEEWMAEKEARMKIEVSNLQLQSTASHQDQEIRSLRAALSSKSADVDELLKLKSILEETRKELDMLSKREKMYLDEIELSSGRERKVLIELEEMSHLQKRTTQELDRVSAREAARLKDVEYFQMSEEKLKAELNEAYTRSAAQAEELGNMDTEIARLKQENTGYAQNLSELRALTQDARAQITKREQDISELKTVELDLKGQIEQVKAQLASSAKDVADLTARNKEMSEQLNSELESKADIQQQNKDRLVMVAEKINELQQTLVETQAQVEEFRRTEEVLRATIRQREETITQRDKKVGEQEHQLIELESNLAKGEYILESFKVKKKEDMMAVQERFLVAKSAMEEELNTLRSQLHAKGLAFSSSSDELSRLKITVSDLTADKFRLEARVSELVAAESSSSRQVSTLSSQLKARDQEIQMMSIKIATLSDLSHRLEEEVSGLRSALQSKESELARLQANVTDMNRRLRYQVTAIMDRESVNTGAIGSATSPRTETAPSSNIALHELQHTTQPAPRGYVSERTPSVSSMNGSISKLGLSSSRRLSGQESNGSVATNIGTGMMAGINQIVNGTVLSRDVFGGLGNENENSNIKNGSVPPQPPKQENAGIIGNGTNNIKNDVPGIPYAPSGNKLSRIESEKQVLGMDDLFLDDDSFSFSSINTTRGAIVAAASKNKTEEAPST